MLQPEALPFMEVLEFDPQTIKGIVTKTPYPSVMQLNEAILRLDNEKYNVVYLVTHVGRLGIGGGLENRVLVIFRGTVKYPRNGKLLSPEYKYNDRKLDIIFDITAEDDSYYSTVTKETAVYVATYLLENGDLPKGLTWQGENLDS